MSIASEVANLTTNTTALLQAVNISKATLDASVATAVAAKDTTLGYKDTAVAAKDLAVPAAAAASISAVSAQTASAMAVQAWGASMAPAEILPALSQSVHPYGTIVASCIDRPTGDWVNQCQDKSWYKEGICTGSWLEWMPSEAVARAYAARKSTELVANGDFSNGTTGWTTGSATQAVSGGELTLTNTAGYGYSSRSFSVETGKTYLVHCSAKVGTGSPAQICAGTSVGGSTLGSMTTTSTSTTPIGFVFTASATATVYVSVYNGPAGAGVNYFDNISVREVDSTIDVTGDYYGNTTDGNFYTLSSGSGQTQVYRGNQREYPSAIWWAAESGRVIGYDISKPGCPMWMVFRGDGLKSVSWATSTATQSCIDAVNGVLVTCSSNGGGSVFDFPDDDTKLIYRDYHYALTSSRLIKDRNSATFFTESGDGYVIVSHAVNHVAITVLPNAPYDEFGNQIPTIAVFTAGGTSVITDSGAVATASEGFSYTNGSIDTEGYLWGLNPGNGLTTCFGLPSNWTVNGFARLQNYTAASVPATLGDATKVENRATGSASGVTILYPNPSDPTKGGVATISPSFNSGIQIGEIQRCWLSDTSTTVGATEADRSVKAKPLTVFGTGLTKTALGTPGSSLVAYSGFSATSYLEESYSADLDFGTGDFSIYGWVNVTGTNTIFHRALSGSDGGLALIATSAGSLYFYASATTAFSMVLGAGGCITLQTPQLISVNRSSGILSLWVNDRQVASVPFIADLTYSNAVTKVGVQQNLTTPVNGSLALWRITKTPPSADQIAQIYRDELPLIQGVNCVLAGTSAAVTALAHSKTTDVLSIGTNQYRSDFKGLQRVNVVAGAVTTLAAEGETIVTNDSIYQPALYLRDEINRNQDRNAAFGCDPKQFRSVAAGSTASYTLQKGWKPTAVYLDGVLKWDTLNSTAYDYNLTTDGYSWKVNFTPAIANLTKITVFAVPA